MPFRWQPRVLAAAYEREDAQVKLIGSLERQIDRLRVQLDEKKKDEQDARIAKVANVLYDAKFGDSMSRCRRPPSGSSRCSMSMTEAWGGGWTTATGTTRSTTPGTHTSHACGIEVITVTRHMPFDIGNAIKYVVRAEMKGGLEDLRKSEVYRPTTSTTAEVLLALGPPGQVAAHIRRG